MECTFEDLVLRLRETAAVGQATCIDYRLNRPSTISLVNGISVTIFATAGAVWAATTSASLVVPILLAVTSIVALAYTTYKIYLWTQIPSEARCREWEDIFHAILIGDFTNAVNRLEAIAKRTFPGGVQNAGHVVDLGDKFWTLDVRMIRQQTYFQLLMADSLTCSTAIHAPFLNTNEIEEAKRKILSWTQYVRCGYNLVEPNNKIIDEAKEKKFSVRSVENHVPLLLSSTFYWANEFLSEDRLNSPDPKNWSGGKSGSSILHRKTTWNSANR